MKKYITVIVLLLMVKSGFAQNTNLGYQRALKVYNLTTVEQHSKYLLDTGGYSYRSTRFTEQILHPTIAFQWKTKKNNFHEVELKNFMINKTETKNELVTDSNGKVIPQAGGPDMRSTLISVRYEYILNFNKSKDKKFVPSLGFGISPYLRQNTILPAVSSQFRSVEKYYGAGAYIIPRLSWYVTSRLFIDVNIPVCIVNAFYLSDTGEDPTVPTNQRAVTSFSFEQFPKLFSGRIGIGVKL